MLFARNVTVRFGRVELRVGPNETFHLSTPAGDQAWDSPVYVAEPAQAIAKIMKKMGMSLKEIRRIRFAQKANTRANNWVPWRSVASHLVLRPSEGIGIYQDKCDEMGC